MRRFASAVLMTLVATALAIAPATAGVTWCRADPIVLLNNTEVQIWVAIPEEYERLVTGPITVKIFTPNKVKTEVTYLDAGFNGRGEEVVFKHRGKVAADGTFTVDIIARVPLDQMALRNEFGVSEIPMQVEIIISDGQRFVVEGTHQHVDATFTAPSSN